MSKIDLHTATKANRINTLTSIVLNTLKGRKPWSIIESTYSEGTARLIVDLGGKSKYKITITEF